MSADQIPAKEFMRRLSSIDASLKDIAKSLGTLTKIVNRQFPGPVMMVARSEDLTRSTENDPLSDYEEGEDDD